MMENAKMKLIKELQAENILDTEDLDEVSAGTCYEMADDSRFLNVLMRGLSNQPDRYGATKIWFCDDIRDELEKAWKSLGIIYVNHNSIEGANSYFLELTHEKISRAEAWDYVQARVGKYLKESDWKW